MAAVELEMITVDEGKINSELKTVIINNHQTFGSGTNESGQFGCVNLIPTFQLTVVN
jgi:hypothetical protein